MIICIIGSGGREHAICKTISSSSKVSKIYCMPGNAGTQQLAQNIELDINNFEKVLKFLKDSKVDLVIVGPEKPLVNGIVDYLENNNIKVFGPRKIPSQLEGSKTFTKNICKKYNIPTAKFGIFDNFLILECCNNKVHLQCLVNWYSSNLEKRFCFYCNQSNTFCKNLVDKETKYDTEDEYEDEHIHISNSIIANNIINVCSYIILVVIIYSISNI